MSYYAFLTFNTSFTGKDSLITQFNVGNGNSPANQLVSAGFLIPGVLLFGPKRHANPWSGGNSGTVLHISRWR